MSSLFPFIKKCNSCKECIDINECKYATSAAIIKLSNQTDANNKLIIKDITLYASKYFCKPCHVKFNVLRNTYGRQEGVKYICVGSSEWSQLIQDYGHVLKQIGVGKSQIDINHHRSPWISRDRDAKFINGASTRFDLFGVYKTLKLLTEQEEKKINPSSKSTKRTKKGGGKTHRYSVDECIDFMNYLSTCDYDDCEALNVYLAKSGIHHYMKALKHPSRTAAAYAQLLSICIQCI